MATYTWTNRCMRSVRHHSALGKHASTHSKVTLTPAVIAVVIYVKTLTSGGKDVTKFDPFTLMMAI